MSTDPISATEGAPTTELVTSVAGDRCSNCQTPLAPDQRYCVNCGERRGGARFSKEMLAAPAAPAAAAAAAPPRRQHPRFSSATTLVAGVLTLLVAMGVGVLIGHYSNNSTPQRAADQVITVGGGTGTGAASTGATGAATAATAATAHHHATHVKPTVVHITQKTQKAATAAATKVLGGSASKNISSNVQQQVGGSCSGGAGCQNGHFTGNFFPGG